MKFITWIRSFFRKSPVTEQEIIFDALYHRLEELDQLEETDINNLFDKIYDIDEDKITPENAKILRKKIYEHLEPVINSHIYEVPKIQKLLTEELEKQRAFGRKQSKKQRRSNKNKKQRRKQRRSRRIN